MNKKGISFVALTIMVALLFVLLGFSINGVGNAIQNARKSAFASDLASLEDAVNTYYIQFGELPIYAEDSKYKEYIYESGKLVEKDDNSNYITLSTGTQIEEELEKNNDKASATTDVTEDSSFYKLDLKKIDVQKIKRGTGNLGDDDIFVIAYPTKTLYYLKGINVQNELFYSLVNLDDIQKRQINSNESIEVAEVVQTISGVTVKKDSKDWSNKLGIAVSAYLESGESLVVRVPQPNENDELQSSQNAINIPVGSYIEKTLSLNNNTIKINSLKTSLGLTDQEIANFFKLRKEDRFLAFEKKQGNLTLGTIKIDISKYDIGNPIIENYSTTSSSGYNLVTFDTDDYLSGVKEVRYVYLKKYNEKGVAKSEYTDENGNDITSFTTEYMSQKGKIAILSSGDSVQIEVPKDVSHLYITVFDKAGNGESATKEVVTDIYAGINLTKISGEIKSTDTSKVSRKLNISYVIKSGFNVTSAKTSISTDGTTFETEQNLTLNKVGNDFFSTYEFTTDAQKEVYVKLVVTNSNNKTETRIKKIDISEKAYNMLSEATPGIIYSENRYYTDSNGDNAIVPAGFKVSSKSDEQTINKGLVIIDKLDNEFVWIPVDGTSKYKKNFGYPCRYSASDENTFDVPEELPTGVDENTQIAKYGGFYIGRYEAGVPANQTTIDGSNSSTSNVEGIPQSKKNINTWTNITPGNASINAKSLCNNSTVKSGLMTGTMWDTMCDWLNDSGYNLNNSRTYGNYNRSLSPANITGYGTKQKTGFSDIWKTNNIYDLAGNVWEITNEKTSNQFIHRGGSYWDDSENYLIYGRSFANDPYIHVGFRIALYIM